MYCVVPDNDHGNDGNDGGDDDGGDDICGAPFRCICCAMRATSASRLIFFLCPFVSLFGWLTIAGDTPHSISTPVVFVLCALRVSGALPFLARFLIFLRVCCDVLGICCDVMLCPPAADVHRHSTRAVLNLAQMCMFEFSLLPMYCVVPGFMFSGYKCSNVSVEQINSIRFE